MRHEVEALRVEVDHSHEVVRLLRAKVERERRALGSVERELDDEYNKKQKESADQYGVRVQQLTEQLNRLIHQKKELVERCKELALQVRKAEDEVSEAVRRIHKEAETSAERERKAFRAGYEERLQQVLQLSYQNRVDPSSRNWR